MAKKKSKRPFQEKVGQWRESSRKKQAKESPITKIREKPKKKRMPVAGKCSPGKTLRRGKCVPMIEGPRPAKKYSKEWFTGKKKKVKKRKIEP